MEPSPVSRRVQVQQCLLLSSTTLGSAPLWHPPSLGSTDLLSVRPFTNQEVVGFKDLAWFKYARNFLFAHLPTPTLLCTTRLLSFSLHLLGLQPPVNTY